MVYITVAIWDENTHLFILVLYKKTVIHLCVGELQSKIVYTKKILLYFSRHNDTGL